MNLPVKIYTNYELCYKTQAQSFQPFQPHPRVWRGLKSNLTATHSQNMVARGATCNKNPHRTIGIMYLDKF